ncbi:uncharacterized protein LOC135944336 [Cloeon dipterum]|uniref:uncharacterized protein LOC135944336 n=1 Tax=Cloeon dipterum TaxID=197152 RepID=UPI0032207422
MMSLLIQMALPALVLVLFAASGRGQEMQRGFEQRGWSSDGDYKLVRGPEVKNNMGNLDYNDIDSQTEVPDKELDMIDSTEEEATFEPETEPAKPVVKIAADAGKGNQKQQEVITLFYYLVATLLAEFLILAIIIVLGESAKKFGSKSTEIVEV